MGKIRGTGCKICFKKFKGKVGLLAHHRLKHPQGIDILKETQEYQENSMDDKFLKVHEKLIIQYNHCMATLGCINNKANIFLKILVEWEKAHLRGIAYNYPVFKYWKFWFVNPFSQAIEVFYEVIGFMACEYVDCFLRVEKFIKI